MGKSTHRRLTYANVTATLALLFSMSGGALAANHYLINSTRQINPRVLRALTNHTAADTALFNRLAPTASVAKAGVATTADSAGTAGSAITAGSATNAANATNATNAAHATVADNATTVDGSSVRWLLVNPSGTIVSQSGGFTVSAHPAAGDYVIDAGSPVTGHALMVSNGLAGDSAFRGMPVAGLCGPGGEALNCEALLTGADNGTHIFVGTTTIANNAQADHSFYLMLF
jgi:hypothetical protein